MKYITLLVSLFLLQSSYAQDIIFNGSGQQDIADKVFMLEDPDGSLTIEGLIKNSDEGFKRYESPIFNFGFTTSTFWIKFEVNNTSGEQAILEFASPHLEEVLLYKVEGQNVTSEEMNGYQLPVSERKLKHHFSLFEIEGDGGVFYAKISKPLQPVPFRIMSKDRYEIKKYRQLLFYGFVIGFMIFVILSNVFFFYSLKNRLFLFYAGMAVLYLSYAAFVMDGFILYFIDNVDLRFWYKHIPSLGVVLHILYAIAFLEIKNYSARVYKIMLGIAIYFSIYFVLKIFIPDQVLYAMNTLNAFISFFAMVYMGFVASKKGNRLGIYFAAAYLIYLILVLTEGFYVQTGNPGYIAELSFVTWATLIEAFILSFLLSKRFEWEKQEVEEAKRAAQREALQKTRENQRIIQEQNVILEAKVKERTNELSQSLENLKSTQAKLIQSEKLASLGELTAGIAHEIQNPLNFVNNFSDLNRELIDELHEYIEKDDKEEVEAILNDLSLNMEKINQHGQRADSIVKSMLLHSRSSSGQKEKLDVNQLCEEYTKLAFHGFRAKDKSFTGNYKLDLDEAIPSITAVGQDLGRVVLNLIGNAFYIVNEKYKNLEGQEKTEYNPEVKVTTTLKDDKIIIKVNDNGTGIPDHVKEKMFQPFYTTKPTGKGTGLGLSLSFDIVQSYNGTITVDTKQGEGTTFVVAIPLKSLT